METKVTFKSTSSYKPKWRNKSFIYDPHYKIVFFYIEISEIQ